VNRSNLNGTAIAQIRQETRQSLSQHAFADTGRTNHRHVMTTSGSDLKGATRERLPTDVDEIRRVGGFCNGRWRAFVQAQWFGLPTQRLDRVAKRGHW
jgi:hypothetical protein